MTEASNPTYLDLDAIAPTVECVVKLGGTEHKLQPMSLENFIKTTEILNSIPAEPSARDEFENTIKLLQIAFPTMTASMLRGLTHDQLGAILAFAQENNGAKKALQSLEEATEENPQTAAS